MRVSRAQAAENRQKVIEVASRLFREHGFDGIGLNDLMKGAGLTQGGFYKQFESKEDLAAQACEHAMRTVLARWSSAVESRSDDPLVALIEFYLSAGHRNQPGIGCPLAALGAEAARHGPQVQAAFAAGIESHLEVLVAHMPGQDAAEKRDKAMAVLATMVGALLISRAVGDAAAAEQFLAAAAKDINQALGARQSARLSPSLPETSP